MSGLNISIGEIVNVTQKPCKGSYGVWLVVYVLTFLFKSNYLFDERSLQI